MENLDEICKKYNLKLDEKADFKDCMKAYHRLMENNSLTKYFKEFLETYVPEYFAIRLKKGLSVTEIYIEINKECEQYEERKLSLKKGNENLAKNFKEQNRLN